MANTSSPCDNCKQRFNSNTFVLDYKNTDEKHIILAFYCKKCFESFSIPSLKKESNSSLLRGCNECGEKIKGERLFILERKQRAIEKKVTTYGQYCIKCLKNKKLPIRSYVPQIFGDKNF